MEDEVAQDNRVPVSNYLEKQALYKAETHYVNRFYIGANKDGIVRLTFGDQPEENSPTNVKFAVLLTGPGFFTLQNLMNSFIQSQMQNQQNPPGASPSNKPNREELN